MPHASRRKRRKRPVKSKIKLSDLAGKVSPAVRKLNPEIFGTPPVLTAQQRKPVTSAVPPRKLTDNPIIAFLYGFVYGLGFIGPIVSWIRKK